MADSTFSIDIGQFTASVFFDGGRGEPDPETGLPRYDCFGLFRGLLMKVGIVLDDRNISCDAVERVNTEICLDIFKQWEQIEKPEPFCAIVFRTYNPEYTDEVVDHLAIYLGNGKFIHTQRKTGARVIDITDRFWSKRIAGFYRYIGPRNV